MPRPPRLVRVRTRGLFGLYDYDIPSDSEPFGELRVLYGDNGCGKTTILRMLRHVLSPESNGGHRTALKKIPFKRFEVEFDDGTVVVAERSTPTRGSFSLSVRDTTGKTFSHEFFPTTESKSVSEIILYDKLRELGLNVHHVPDNRQIETAAHAEETVYRDDDGVMHIIRHHRTSAGRADYRERGVLDKALGEAIGQASAWIRRQATRSSEAGSVEANTIYTEIARQLAANGDKGKSDGSASRMAGLREAITDLVARNDDLVRVGLSPNLGLGELLLAVNTARVEHHPLALSILTPYVDGVKARFDALSGIQELLDVFLSHLNNFFANKRVSFGLTDGLKILVRGRKLPLPPASLSSGEQQLLLMLCSALSARDNASIFIIDEPEISLNVKWQRNFLGALLDCVHGSNAQFLIASHSIELITPYKKHVTRLPSIDSSHGWT